VLTDGRISTYILREAAGLSQVFVYFRAQTQPYLGLPDNCYFVELSPAFHRLTRRLAASNLVLKEGATPSTPPILTWWRERVTWYTWLDASLEAILRVITDRWYNSTWTNVITWDIANPLWQTAPQNYLGFSMGGTDASNQMWIDDTLVYKRA